MHGLMWSQAAATTLPNLHAAPFLRRVVELLYEGVKLYCNTPLNKCTHIAVLALLLCYEAFRLPLFLPLAYSKVVD